MTTLTALHNISRDVNAYILLTSLKPFALYQAYKNKTNIAGFYKDFNQNSDNQDIIYAEYIGWSIYDTAINVTVLFDYVEHEYMHTVEFFKRDPKFPFKFDTYLNESSECVRKCMYEFIWANETAVICYNDKEIHKEDMSLFEFAIGIDRYNPDLVKLSTDKTTGFNEFSTSEATLGIIIPDEFNFFKKYQYVPY